MQRNGLPISAPRTTRSSFRRSSRRTTASGSTTRSSKPGVLMHVASPATNSTRCAPATPRLLSIADHPPVRRHRGQVLRRLPALHQPQQRRVPADRQDQGRPPASRAESKEGYPVGGIGNSITNIVHTQGWVHCHSAATDASGVVKAVMDELHPYFTSMELPGQAAHRLRLLPQHVRRRALLRHRHPRRSPHGARASTTTSCPRSCEIPTSVASCPTGAIRPATVDGKQSSSHRGAQCMYCGNCYTVCPSMTLNDPETRRHLDLGRRQGVQRAQRADVLQAGHSLPAQQPAALARGRRRGQEHRRHLCQATPASTSGWASGSSASAGRGSSS